MPKLDKNNIPTCPVDHTHTVKVNVIMGKEYYHCKECCEDVAFLEAKHGRATPPPLPRGQMNSSFSLYLINNPHTSFSTVHGVLTTMLNLDDMMADQVANDCDQNGEAFICSTDTRQEAQALLDRANNWLDQYEPRTSRNGIRNLVIELRED